MADVYGVGNYGSNSTYGGDVTPIGIDLPAALRFDPHQRTLALDAGEAFSSSAHIIEDNPRILRLDS